MEVGMLMTRCPVILRENATALEAIEKMKSAGCGILPVGDEKNILGVITDRDIMMRASAKKKALDKTPVSEIMSEEVFFCEDHDVLQRALHMMYKNNVRRILVRDKQKNLIGILSLGDILRRIPDPLQLSTLLRPLELQAREEELI